MKSRPNWPNILFWAFMFALLTYMSFVILQNE
jgi:hypothetical protein